jgi:nucleoside-diphosphate-sugar epimerase
VKILLTGAGGFLGGLLAKAWSGRHEVVPIEGRTAFAEKLEAAGGGFELLVHAGFEVDFGPGHRAFDANLASARAVAAFCRSGRAGQLLFLSGAAVLGVGKEPHARNEAAFGTTDPGFFRYAESSYVRSKIECEKLFRAEKLPLTVLYLTTVYGPGMAEGTLRSLSAGVAPPGGTSILDHRDFLAAMQAWLGRRPAGAFVVNGENILFRDLIGSYRRTKGLGAPWTIPPLAKVLVPFAAPVLGAAGAAVLEASFGFKFYSAARFQSETGWKPAHAWALEGAASFLA